MELTHTDTPADLASRNALAAVLAALDNRQNFILEAGAGAGKTYSLVKALRHLLDKQGPTLLKRGQRIACITYTNVATDEIRARTDEHPAILSCTVHSFCWSLIANFQSVLRTKLPLIEGWPERLAKADGLRKRRIEYNLGHPRVTEEAVLLGHNDVIKLTAMLMESPKFREVFTSRFPVVLVDEYQDTNQDFAASLLKYFVTAKAGPLIGFFGDHWQRIYGDGCGAIETEALIRIGKGANFRSAAVIVDVLNKMRPTLPQAVNGHSDTFGGSVASLKRSGTTARPA